jgi:HD-like signal output (HDOD) protein
MRVFFATPDPNQPGAVADALLARGYAWQVLSYARPDESREVLARDAADAVVVDRDHADAEPLLRHLLYTAPATARLVLCRDLQDEVPAALLAMCHGLLPSNAPVDTLAEALIAYAQLAQSLDRPALRAQVGALTRLPGAPKLYMAICRALDDPNVEIDAIAAQVMADPVLSARVLQIANSAMYGAGRQITSIPYAVTRLGLKTTRNLVLAAELYALSGVDAVRAERVRERSLLAAWLAPRLMAPHLDPDVATTAALLAGISGLLPELDGGPVAALPTAPPIEDEAAAYLMGLWQLPTILQQAVAWQRTPRLSGGRFGVVGAVHVATALAFDRPVDEAWLERCDMAAHLPGWRELAHRMDRSAA